MSLRTDLARGRASDVLARQARRKMQSRTEKPQRPMKPAVAALYQRLIGSSRRWKAELLPRSDAIRSGSCARRNATPASPPPPWRQQQEKRKEVQPVSCYQSEAPRQAVGTLPSLGLPSRAWSTPLGSRGCRDDSSRSES